MGAGIEGTFDIWPMQLRPPHGNETEVGGSREDMNRSLRFLQRTMMFNLEVNNTCKLTSICGNACILNARELVPGKTLDAASIINAATEVITNGQNIRHFVFAGKEPLESPEILFSILEKYHATPCHVRPGATAFISADFVALKKLLPKFVQFPVTTCLVSADTASSALHIEKNNWRLIEAALRLREAKGAEFATVQTALNGKGLKPLIELGKRLFAEGIDQWSLFPFLKKHAGTMVSTLSPQVSLDIAFFLAEKFAGSTQKIVIELDMQTLEQLKLPITDKGWRVECLLPGTMVTCIATPPSGNKFIRLRYDGEILNHEDLLAVGRSHGTLGSYQSGKLAEVIQRCSKSDRDSTVYKNQIPEVLNLQ